MGFVIDATRFPFKRQECTFDINFIFILRNKTGPKGEFAAFNTIRMKLSAPSWHRKYPIGVPPLMYP